MTKVTCRRLPEQPGQMHLKSWQSAPGRAATRSAAVSDATLILQEGEGAADLTEAEGVGADLTEAGGVEMGVAEAGVVVVGVEVLLSVQASSGCVMLLVIALSC